MNWQIIVGVWIILAIVAFFGWQAWKGTGTTKAVATVLQAHAEAVDAKFVSLKAHIGEVVKGELAKLTGPADVAISAPVAAAVTSAATPATPEAALAALDTVIAAAQAKKDAITKAQQALAEAMAST